jgi:hypothetical protein
MFLIGMGAFTVVSVLAGLAQSPGQLIGARLVQGLSAAMLVPQVLALITRTFPVAERTGALAWFGVTGAVSGVVGQALGGLLLDADVAGLGWRFLFLLNLPVGAVVLVFAARLLPVVAPGLRPSLDPIGVVGISAGVALALAPLVLGRSEHWAAWIWALLAASVPVLVLTLAYEARRENPLVDLTLFRSRTFSAGSGIAVAFLAFFTSSVFVLSLLLQTGLGLSPLEGGLSFTPFALFAIVTAFTGRRFIARYGPPSVIRAGCSISALGLVLCLVILALGGAGIGVGWLVAGLAVVGAGNSMIMTAYLGATLASVRPDQAGIASGTLNTFQQFAGSAGLAVVGAVFFAVLGATPGAAQYVSATSVALWIGLGLVVVIAGLSWLLPDPAGRRTAEPVPSEPLAEV